MRSKNTEVLDMLKIKIRASTIFKCILLEILHNIHHVCIQE